MLQHILDGHNNRKIAELLYLAPSTVSTVISHLLKKLDANDRTDAMVKIIRNGWVDALREIFPNRPCEKPQGRFFAAWKI
ncbi:two-component system, NarL family, response regulator DegU [Salisediminibacterium halotolerans]|uniref:Two-component system, NarL family, response regulator DegU n=1 Tax=Salisediminibacterium halotolerans TaxID=517425 RepID=A0A1H9TRY3_9BACI|nr:two-component system, NarL family, response regulator DegU [Salisediminibacterium haloalkalitolerans]